MSGHLVLTALYVPGDRPDRFGKAAASGADVVVVDLEDAVAPAAKADARSALLDWLPAAGGATVHARINAPGSPWWADDLAALAASGVRPSGVRVPKAESAEQLDEVVDALGPSVGLHPIVETARGVEALGELARHPAVAGIGLGEADLAAQLRTTGDRALGWVRSRLVIAARAADLPAPLMSVWPDLSDVDGLDRSCRGGRAAGFVGRSAIHPRQLPVIVSAFRPSPEEVAAAAAVLDALAAADEAGRGVAVSGGAMVDAAMRPSAQHVLDVEAAAARAAARFAAGQRPA